MTRREAIVAFCQFLAGSPLLKADRKFKELGNPLLKPINVFDFAKLAKEKLDPLAWDYLDEGSDDEVSLRANRTDFDRITIRPHFLINDVSAIDTSTTLLGKTLNQPIYLPITFICRSRAARIVSFPMASRKLPWAPALRTL
jgi:hypothetical protein